ncbi:MAG: hypothetical protein QM758_00470 [Armatimonas sp.]
MEPTLSASGRWNAGAWLLHWIWLFAHRQVRLGAIYLVLSTMPVVLALVAILQFFLSNGRDISSLGLAPIYLLLGGLVVLLAAIPIGLRGDAIALKTGRFSTDAELTASRRNWAIGGAVAALVYICICAVGFWGAVQMGRHSPEGLNAQLLTASTRGDVAEIRAIVDENNEKIGIGATNLNFDNAISNARFGGHTEAINLLQAEKARRQQDIGGAR